MQSMFSGFEPLNNDLIQAVSSERAKTLGSLLLDNHEENALLHHGALHNHVPHILCSAYIMGSTGAHLKAIFDDETRELERWTSFQPVINGPEDVRAKLGHLDYQQAYVKFFERELQVRQGDWKNMVFDHLFGSDCPLLGGVVGGFGHPLILIADAFELSNPTVAVEALALTAVDYNALHQILESPAPSLNDSKASAMDILQRIRSDTRFDNLVSRPGIQNTLTILSVSDAALATLSYINAIDLSPSTSQEELVSRHHEFTDLALLLLSTTHKTPAGSATGALTPHHFDFYLTHMLTLSSALRVLLPLFPLAHAHSLLRAQWLLIVLTYITQLRPLIKPEIILEAPPSGSSSNIERFDDIAEWDRLTSVALNMEEGKGLDPHFVKVIRSLKEFALMWEDSRFLRAAVRFEKEFEKEFEGWTGFGKEGEETMDVV